MPSFNCTAVRMIAVTLAAAAVLVQAVGTTNFSLQDIGENMGHIVDCIGNDCNTLACFGRTCRIGHKMTKLPLKGSRILYHKTPINQLPALIQNLAHDIESGDLESKRSAEIIFNIQNAVHICKRMMGSCRDRSLMGYDGQLSQPVTVDNSNIGSVTTDTETSLKFISISVQICE